MADFLINLKNNYRVLKKASALLMTPYVYNSEFGRHILGTETFDITSIIGDTLSIVQNSGEESELRNEFKRSPITPLYEDGDVVFSADCVDMQGTIFQILHNAKIGLVNDEYREGFMAMDENPKEMYACIQILFHDENAPRVVLPKVYMTNTTEYSNLRSSVAKHKIVGKVMPNIICSTNDTSVVKFANTNEEGYVVETKMFFAQKDFNFGVCVRNDGDVYYMSKYNVSTNECGVQLYEVNILDGNLNVIDSLSNN